MFTTKGAHILHWQPNDHHEPVLFCSTLADIQGPKAIRGGIPLCWPWFGPKEGHAQHGWARTHPWSVVSNETNHGTQKLIMTLARPLGSEASTFDGLSLTLQVIADNNLKVMLTTRNEGDQTSNITQALHTYFLVGHIENTLLDGLSGKTYVDKTKQETNHIQNGLLAIDQETDRIYRNVNRIEIQDHHFRRLIQVESEHASAMVVWNPWEEKCKSIGDLEDGDYQRFVCVEAANVPEPVSISPGEEFTLDMKISVSELR